MRARSIRIRNGTSRSKGSALRFVVLFAVAMQIGSIPLLRMVKKAVQ